MIFDIKCDILFRNTQNSTPLFIAAYVCTKIIRYKTTDKKALLAAEECFPLQIREERDWGGAHIGFISTCNVSFIHIKILNPIG